MVPLNKIRKAHETLLFFHKFHICLCNLLIPGHLDAIRVRDQITKDRVFHLGTSRGNVRPRSNKIKVEFFHLRPSRCH